MRKLRIVKTALHTKPILLVVFFFLLISSPPDAYAYPIAEQTSSWKDQLNVWAASQDLGNNLSGVAGTFTFRTLTSASFNYTANNTRIYDKSNSYSSINGCGTTSDPNSGLTITTSGVPSGYQNVTVDFSCRNYEFIPGHSYVIKISNANQCSGCLKISGNAVGSTGTDYFTSGGLKYSFDNQACFIPMSNYQNACNTWTNVKDDIYFSLSNTSAPPKEAVIFIPGIGGSELQTAEAINWSFDNGHGGTFSNNYPNGEKVWVNQGEAVKLGDDDYFDILKLKPDGVTSEANLSLTGNLTPFGYSDIDSFFAGLGYTKGTNYFVFAYDWRKDVSSTKDNLDTLVSEAVIKSGKPKVNIVAHSMGGLVARNYIADSIKATKVHRLISLGVPHVGSVNALKNVIYGVSIDVLFYGLKLSIIPSSEVKDISQNLPGIFELVPNKEYYNFYTNSDLLRPPPFSDDRDIDNNSVNGLLDYNNLKTLLTNLQYNMTVFNLAETFHNPLSGSLNNANGVNLYHITGSAQPTLGQIKETYLITWPQNIIPKQEEIFINGDGTVPLYSASLKSDSKDLSAGATIYYVEQVHNDLVNSSGAAMQTVKTILNEESTLPADTKTQKVSLEGQQISVDQNAIIDLYDESNNHTGLDSNGEVETNIASTFYTSINNTANIFTKKSVNKNLKVKVKSSSTSQTNLKISTYSSDSINKTITYQNIPLSNSSLLQLNFNPSSFSTPTLTLDGSTVSPTSEVTGDNTYDKTPPTTTITLSGTKDTLENYKDEVTIALDASDTGSGVLKTEYSLDNGKTVQNYTVPFNVYTGGEGTILFKSTDNLGNGEITKSKTFTIRSYKISSSSTSENSTIDQTTPTDPLNQEQASQRVLGASKSRLDSLKEAVAGATLKKESPTTIQPKKNSLINILIIPLSIAGGLSLALTASLFKYPPKKI